MNHSEKTPLAAASNVVSLLQGGKLDQAEIAALALHRKFPNSAESNYVLARALAEKSNRKAAIPLAEVAVRLGPENPEYLMFLGWLFSSYSLFEKASPLLHRAHELAPESFAANMALAKYYFEIASGQKALGYFEPALRVAPNEPSRHDTLASYGKCLMSTGDTEKAEEIFQDLMSQPKHRTFALTQLAMLRKHDSNSDCANSIRDELLNPRLSKGDRRDLNLCLGQLHENSGNYKVAFELFALARLVEGFTFDKERHRQTIDGIISFYSEALFDTAKTFGHPSEVPVFVVGMPRSGTTLIEQIVAAHRNATGIGEIPRMLRLEDEFRAQYMEESPHNRAMEFARSGELKARAARDLECYATIAPKPDASRIVDKLPANFMSLGYIHLCFPNAKVVHCRRSPADSFISSFQNRLSPWHSYAHDQQSYAAYYFEKERLMAHWKSCFPENILEIQYEKLCEEPEPVTRELIEFLGLPWDDNCLRFFENQSSVITFSKVQVRSPIYKSSVERWKRYEAQLQPLIKALNSPPV